MNTSLGIPAIVTKDLFDKAQDRMAQNKKASAKHKAIGNLLNAIYLYDDRITLVFNFTDGTKTIPFAELEESGLGSDINALATPKIGKVRKNFADFYLLFAFRLLSYKICMGNRM